jgi:hypothetical protein
MKFNHSFPAALAAVIALGLAQAPLVNAQTAAPASDALTVDSTTSTVIDDTKLDQFAEAYVAIQAIQKDAVAKQSTSSDPAAAQQQSEVQGKMAEAVQKSGLQVNEFNQIAQAMVTDADLRAKVIGRVQQRVNSGG